MREKEIVQGEFMFEETASFSYKVCDIVPGNICDLKAAFILESPYRDEVRHACPIAGGSGKAIAKFMNSVDQSIPTVLPFGRYLKRARDGRFAVLNCSNYPMDINAYESVITNDKCQMANEVKTADGRLQTADGKREAKSDKSDKSDTAVHCQLSTVLPYEPRVLDRIRKYIQTAPSAGRDVEVNATLEKLVADFRRRLQPVLSANALIIVCGNIARNFLVLSGADLTNPCMVFVPHPSRNQWSQGRYVQLMSELKRRLAEQLMR